MAPYCTVAGSNDKFFIYIRLSRTIEEATARNENTFEVYDRRARTTKGIIVPGSFSRVRLDGHWLIGTVVEPNFQHRVNPGSENRRTAQSDRLPNTDQLYAGTEPPQYFPGICQLRDLAEDRTITLETGQADTEILGVLNNETVIYRQSAALQCSHRAIVSGESRLIAKDDNVPEIHWMLIGGS